MFGFFIFITQYSIFMTHFPNFVSSTTVRLNWFCFYNSISLSQNSKFEFELWKLRTIFCCFQVIEMNYSDNFVIFSNWVGPTFCPSTKIGLNSLYKLFFLYLPRLLSSFEIATNSSSIFALKLVTFEDELQS